MLRYVNAVSLVLVLVLGASAQTKQTSVAIHDNSDWWSITRDGGYAWSGIDDQAISTDKSNFEILGVSFKGGDPVRDLSARLGRTTNVVRGDAATARDQRCYVSARASSPVYLVLEADEVGSTFYLFLKGADWNGSRYCSASTLINERLGTSSGLRIGITRGQIQAILGKPTTARGDRIAYIRSVRVKSAPAQLKKMRAEYPQMSEADLQSNYAYYDENTYIEARFKNSRLIYLAISESETF